MQELREYQSSSVRAILDALRTRTRLLCSMPTGAGKTVVAAAVAREFPRVLWLAHRVELLRQAASALDQAGHKGATVMSIFRDLPEGPFDLIVLDEAHHAACRTLRGILDRFRGAKVLGMTATPVRADRRVLLFEDCMEEARRGELVEQGWLVEAIIHSVRVRQNIEIADWMRDHRDLVVPGILFVTTHAEAREYSRRLDGLSVEIVHPQSDREGLLARFEEGRIDVLVTCMILAEGTDIVPLRGVVIARNSGGRCSVLQMIGRAMRPSVGKDVCNLVEPVALGVERCPIARAVRASRHLIYCRKGNGWSSFDAGPNIRGGTVA